MSYENQQQRSSIGRPIIPLSQLSKSLSNSNRVLPVKQPIDNAEESDIVLKDKQKKGISCIPATFLTRKDHSVPSPRPTAPMKPPTATKRITIPKIAKPSTISRTTSITNLSQITTGVSSSSRTFNPGSTKSLKDTISLAAKKSIDSFDTSSTSITPPTPIFNSTSLLYEFDKFKNDASSLVNQYNQSIIKLNSFINLLTTDLSNGAKNKNPDNLQWLEITEVTKINEIIKMVTITSLSDDHLPIQPGQDPNASMVENQETVMLLNYKTPSKTSSLFAELNEETRETFRVQLINYLKLGDGVKLYYNFRVSNTC